MIGVTGKTVTVAVAVAEQPPGALPVTVYVVVTVGVALTSGPVVTLNPAAGVQVYVAAPLAVRII